MDFAMQTDLLRATQYFNEQMEKVYVRRNCRITPFSERAHNPGGGQCYYLSTWALMGLKPNDVLVRGQIDLPERPGWKAHSNYKHGWVQFSFEGDHYIYDPCEAHVWPQTPWEETFSPHKETFRKSLQEVLDLVFKFEDKTVYHVSDYIYQFKGVKDMKFGYDAERNGFLKDTLSGAQMYYCGSGQVSYFLAEDRNR